MPGLSQTWIFFWTFLLWLGSVSGLQLPGNFGLLSHSDISLSSIRFCPGPLNSTLAPDSVYACTIGTERWTSCAHEPVDHTSSFASFPNALGESQHLSNAFCLFGHDFRMDFVPWGEALNPGPSLALNLVNPTGVRSKEQLLFDLPRGITCIAETHLAAPGIASSCGLFRYLAKQDQRCLRLLPGASAPLRARSLTTGVWSGVMQLLSDLPCHRLQMHWPNGEYGLGRVQTANFRMGDVLIQGTVLYGWSRGPTWPRAHQATRDLLKHLSQEIIHGASGFRFICGDFNGDESKLPELDDWISAGWQEVQTLHARLSGEGPFPTCKGSTQPDRVYISPELATYFVRCEVADLFADHSVVTGYFDIPGSASTYSWWPLPSKIPWSSVDLQAWQESCPTFDVFDASRHNSTDYMTALGQNYESSLKPDFLPTVPNGLPRACRGRAQHSQPISRPRNLKTLRPSRNGEEQPRCDIVSHSVQRWFRQLRRIQSLLRNMRRNSDTVTALCYRLDLWRAIRSACGFAGSFPVWWTVRPYCLPGAPSSLPELLPTLCVVELIFQDFKQNYRALESWNLKHRGETLRAVLRTDMRKAFQSLRPNTASTPDRFVETTVAQVVDVEADTCLVHVDHPLTPTSQVCWTLDDEPARVIPIHPQVLEVHSSIPLTPGQELCMHSQITEPADMHTHLQKFWMARWQKFAEVPAEQWNRLLGFVKAYMPSLDFTLPSITGDMWDQINRRYTSQAARGPDGFDHLDLLNMPIAFREGVVSLFNAIENGCDWPKQLPNAFCHPLPKHPGASLVGEFRPIVIMSVLYRSWSALRSRSLLQQLRHVVGSGVVGFMPSREAGEIWHYVQALVEISLQSNRTLTGVVSDVRKAFESIPRVCLFEVAQHVGLPASLTSSWSRFLEGLERRFLLSDHIGPAIPSNWGFPEGCGLSVVAMTLIDWCWDTYQGQFSPSTVPLSYVDNYEVLACSIGELLTGYATLETFMSLWTLDLDTSKTFFWSTKAQDRTSLRALGKPVCLQNADLGGAMTYCRRTGMGSQRARFDSLLPMWPRLRRSLAPLSVKCLLIRQAFWSKAFHAIGITLLPFSQIGQLRTQAVRALGFGHAGANPGLRLGLLCDSLQTDPGFFQVIRVLDDFRRFASKNPHVLELWRGFAADFDGKMWSGPFSKLYEIFEQIGWSLSEPPWILDHDFCSWNLLDMPHALLHMLLEDAWIQRLAFEVSHRQDYAGLKGINWPPSGHEKRLSALDSAAVNSIREGAFYVGHQQGKFDLQKGILCPFCQQPDTIKHRCADCPALTAARTQHSRILAKWDQLPTALTEHLVPSRNPYFVSRKKALINLPDMVSCFNPQVVFQGPRVDFFTDGSCWDPSVPQLALAAWSVVSATHQCVLTAGPLSGLKQDINRAELTAALSMLLWTYEFQACSTLWTDSSYVGVGVSTLLQDPFSCDFDSNEDLWSQISELLLCIPKGNVQVQHVSSHRLANDQDEPLEEWIAYWNGVADTNAGIAHLQRPVSCRQVCQAHRTWHFSSEQDVDRLRDLHLSVGTLRRELLKADLVPEEEPEVDWAVRPYVQQDDWLDSIPLGWQTRWTKSRHSQTFPTDVVKSLLDILLAERDKAEGAVQLGWLELATLIHLLGFSHPFLVSESGQTCWRSPGLVPAAHLGQLTAGARIRFLKSFVTCFDAFFECDISFVVGLNRVFLGIHPPQKGLCLFVSAAAQNAVDTFLRRWTSNRPVRTSNDLARPF